MNTYFKTKEAKNSVHDVLATHGQIMVRFAGIARKNKISVCIDDIGLDKNWWCVHFLQLHDIVDKK